jgi:hypothetical protein
VAGALGRDHDDVEVSRGSIWPKWMLKPWAKASAAPLLDVGLDVLAVELGLVFSSGARIMTRSASATASPMGLTVRPAWAALTAEAEPGRRPTVTLTPESLRLLAWAWPCEP